MRLSARNQFKGTIVDIQEGTLPEFGEAICDHHGHHERHDCSQGGKCHE